MGKSISFTPEQRLSAVLKRGLVVKIQGPEPFPSSHPHHFVVLNYNPDTESIIIMAHATHQVQAECEKALKQGEDVNKTVVYIKQGSYTFFDKPTVFNCNEVSELSFQGMVNALQNNLLQIRHDELDSGDLQKLIDGALASKTMTPAVANLLKSPEES